MIVLVQYIVDQPARLCIYQIYFIDRCIRGLTGSRKRKNSLNGSELAVSGLEFETYTLMQVLPANLADLIDRPECVGFFFRWADSRLSS